MVHWTAAGSAPPVAAIDTVSAALDPGVVIPELRDSVTCCANAGVIPANQSMKPANDNKRFCERRCERNWYMNASVPDIVQVGTI